MPYLVCSKGTLHEGASIEDTGLTVAYVEPSNSREYRCCDDVECSVNVVFDWIPVPELSLVIGLELGFLLLVTAVRKRNRRDG